MNGIGRMLLSITASVNSEALDPSNNVSVRS